MRKMKVVSWNIARREECWEWLADSDYDFALLQEAAEPPSSVKRRLLTDPGKWVTAGNASRAWRAAAVALGSRIAFDWLECAPISRAREGQLPVSRVGTLAGLTTVSASGKPVTLLSMYGVWENPVGRGKSSFIYADASAHRVISDISALLQSKRNHRIIAAGDLNVLNRYGEHGDAYWGERYTTVFDRLNALGLSFIGPQQPNGRAAEPIPEELPRNSLDVPTYYSRTQNPKSASRQLDFVFASASIAKSVEVRALNDPAHWGPSDHCRVEIQVDLDQI